MKLGISIWNNINFKRNPLDWEDELVKFEILKFLDNLKLKRLKKKNGISSNIKQRFEIIREWSLIVR
jgi:hypothetical protein